MSCLLVIFLLQGETAAANFTDFIDGNEGVGVNGADQLLKFKKFTGGDNRQYSIGWPAGITAFDRKEGCSATRSVWIFLLFADTPGLMIFS